MNKPVVVFGARGMLGMDLMSILRGQNIAAVGYDLPEYDITQADAVSRAMKECLAVVNCAAYTNVEKAESEPELAFRINGFAAGQLGRIAASLNVPVLHISTDFVFDGSSNKPYTETDLPNPLSAYGKSKYEGERLLAASGCRHCIVRVQWTYGKNGVNFVKKMLDNARSGKPMRVVDDQIGSPTSTMEAAKVLVKMLQLPVFPQGVYHLAAEGFVSRYVMAAFIFQTLSMTVSLSPCKTSDFVSAAQRPLNSRFDCGKLTALLGEPMRPWQDPLKDYLEQV